MKSAQPPTHPYHLERTGFGSATKQRYKCNVSTENVKVNRMIISRFGARAAQVLSRSRNVKPRSMRRSRGSRPAITSSSSDAAS